MNKLGHPPSECEQLDLRVMFLPWNGSCESRPAALIYSDPQLSWKNWPKASSRKVSRTNVHVPEFEYGCKGMGGLFRLWNWSHGSRPVAETQFGCHFPIFGRKNGPRGGQ